MKIIFNGEVRDCKEYGLVGYYPTEFEDGKIIIFVKGKICTKANLHFRNPTEQEKEQQPQEQKSIKESESISECKCCGGIGKVNCDDCYECEGTGKIKESDEE